MFTVLAALLPACIAGVWHFGPRALWVMLLTTAAAIAFELLANKAMGKPPTIADGSAAVTGLLLALNLPPTTPEWVCIVGAFIAIVLGKMVYGGLGYNPFNPALVGRIALLLALPSIMSTFVEPVTRHMTWLSRANAVTCATPLGLPITQAAVTNATPFALKIEGAVVGKYTYMDMFLGRTPGCIGETCFLALLIGGVILIALNLIRWQIPVCFIGTVALITGLAHIAAPETFAPPLMEILSGGLGLSAFFMATDMVTSPLTRKGAVVFAVGCGIITSVIRLWGSYPDGASFSILIMNALTPLIDKATAGHPFGMVRNLPKEVKKA